MTRLQEELNQLRESLSNMAFLVTQQLRKSVNALLEEDYDLANEVLYNEKRVNAFELRIDQDCEQIFTLLNPMANDMRFVIATLKINTDMERIGDYAEGIAKLVVLEKKSFNKELVEELELKKMASGVIEMMEGVTKAFVEDDTKAARSIFSKDLVLDDINQKASLVGEKYMRKDLDSIQETLLLITIIRKLERVGDHITNIAEEIIFSKEATVLKHLNKKQ
jgi:phosphate transport system protein